MIKEKIYYIDDDTSPRINWQIYLYEVDRINKKILKYKFSNCIMLFDYVVQNNIKHIIFYGVGYLKPLYDLLEKNNISCEVDYSIYKWRRMIPSEIRMMYRTAIEHFYTYCEIKEMN